MPPGHPRIGTVPHPLSARLGRVNRFADGRLIDVELAGPRLILRGWRPEDARAVFQAAQDGSLHRYLPLPDPYTAAEARRFTAETGPTGRAEGTALNCAVVQRSNGRVVGSATLNLRAATDDGEIGYWIAADARGSGYAAEATRLLVDWGFANRLHRIRLLCDVRNIASIRTAQAAGFTFEGVARSAALGAGDAIRRIDAARFCVLPTDPRDPLPPAFPPLRNPLGDGVLELRMVRPDDARAIDEADDDVAVAWGFTGQKPSAEAARTRAARAGLDWCVGSAARFAMIERASARTAGFSDLYKWGPPGVAMIGYTVHPSFRGRGYTARALRLLTEWAFDVAGFVRLELGTKLANIASQRAARAGGFEQEAVVRGRLRNPDGSYSDEVLFARLRATG
jgi:RimJ/RimL family protein N-acetyltransferase